MRWREALDRYYIKQPRIRRLVTRAIYGTKNTDIEIVGTKLLINSLRENGYLRAYLKTRNSSFLRDELPVLFNLGHFAREGGAFIDAGANVGVYSCLFSRFSNIYANFSVHAFEAAPSTFERLSVNADRLGFAAHHVALAAEPGELRFIEGAVSHVTTLLAKRNAYSIPGREFTVKAAPLHSFSINSNSIILKIDVEGQEASVLRGAEPYFVNRQICAVYCDGWESDEVPTFLRRYGFEFFDGRSLLRTNVPSWSLLALPSGAVVQE